MPRLVTISPSNYPSIWRRGICWMVKSYHIHGAFKRKPSTPHLPHEPKRRGQVFHRRATPVARTQRRKPRAVRSSPTFRTTRRKSASRTLPRRGLSSITERSTFRLTESSGRNVPKRKYSRCIKKGHCCCARVPIFRSHNGRFCMKYVDIGEKITAHNTATWVAVFSSPALGDLSSFD